MNFEANRIAAGYEIAMPKVNILNNYGGFSPAFVKNFGKQQLVKLTVGRNNLRKEVFCTSNHVWRTVKKGGSIQLKKTEELETGDNLPYIKRKSVDGNNGQ